MCADACGSLGGAGGWQVDSGISSFSALVTIQQIVAGLDLSRSGIELSVCLEVSFFCSRESFSQVGSMMV